jgi:dTDP-D-glucose 4,6-dehydratase
MTGGPEKLDVEPDRPERLDFVKDRRLDDARVSFDGKNRLGWRPPWVCYPVGEAALKDMD